MASTQDWYMLNGPHQSSVGTLSPGHLEEDFASILEGEDWFNFAEKRQDALSPDGGKGDESNISLSGWLGCGDGKT
ncbi:MAG: hypothetical protein ALECFALPRED_006988 [Alectoria fallacina]|uniref:Uncharacterized protein n=1 Tax=Alectoria fallacina TaxID=1903189 RepID=A0A8H3G610_9LECA|nr:MAG: hypothetical protein ALECFALPRED_006988 [Alectoria fallacina]